MQNMNRFKTLKIFINYIQYYIIAFITLKIIIP